MACDIEVGDVVIGVPEDQTACPHQHLAEEGWEDNREHVGKMLRVTRVYPDPDSPCILLNFRGDPLAEYCAGEYRKIRPGKIPSPARELELS